MKKVLILIIIIVLGIGIFLFFNNNSDNYIDNILEESNKSENSTSSIAKKEKTNKADTSQYFLLYIDSILEKAPNLVIDGIVSKGSIKVNDEVSVEGLGKKGVDFTIIKVEVENQEKNSASEGDKVKLTLASEFDEYEVEEGQSITILGTAKPQYSIKAKLTNMNGDIEEVVNSSNTFNINHDIKCSIKVISKDENTVKVKLEDSIVVDNGIEFKLKDGTKVIAKGIVVDN